MREYSKYQKAIFAFVKGEPRFEEGTFDGEIDWDAPLPEEVPHVVDFLGKRNAVVEAVAGSGKTTTIVEALSYIDRTITVKKAEPQDDFLALCSGQVNIPLADVVRDVKALFVAFNKHIAEELQRRVPAYVQASTLNSVGWGICRANISRVTLDKMKDENILRTLFSTDHEEDRKVFYKVKNAVCKMVGLLKALLVKDYEQAFRDFNEIADKYDVSTPEVGDSETPFDFTHTVVQVWSQSTTILRYMNFDDQIHAPVFNGWKAPNFDWVFGDEIQDWSPVQTALVKMLVGDGRFVGVGDRHQSIYGFRGADPEAVPNIIAAFDAVVLPLSICYRCPDLIIEKAATLVPHIEKPKDNPKGLGVDATITTPEFFNLVKDGDFVLCRTTAPLVKRCLQLIRAKRKAVVKGRDIGQGLSQLLQQLASNPHTPVGHFLESLSQYKAEQMAKLERAGREAEMMVVEDKCDTLEALALDCRITMDVQRQIDMVFSDNDTDGITLCTAHRSKGLEANRIFHLRPDLCPHPKSKKDWQIEQEDNLLYVLWTRTMAELYTVLKEKDEK